MQGMRDAATPMSRLGLKPEGARLNYSGQHPWRPSEHEASLSLKGGLCRRAVDGSSSCSWAAKPCKCYEKVRESMSTSVGLRLQEAIPLAFFAHLRPPSQGGFITELNSTGNYSSIRLTRTSTSRPWPEFHFGRQPIPDQRRQTRTIPVDTRGMKAEGITSQPEGRDKTGAGDSTCPSTVKLPPIPKLGTLAGIPKTRGTCSKLLQDCSVHQPCSACTIMYLCLCFVLHRW